MSLSTHRDRPYRQPQKHPQSPTSKHGPGSHPRLWACQLLYKHTQTHTCTHRHTGMYTCAHVHTCTHTRTTHAHMDPNPIQPIPGQTDLNELRRWLPPFLKVFLPVLLLHLERQPGPQDALEGESGSESAPPVSPGSPPPLPPAEATPSDGEKGGTSLFLAGSRSLGEVEP